MPLTSGPLSSQTWPAFARLVEKHGGIFGGCWCISFHLEPGEGKRGAATYRAMKEARVREGRAHAALVFDGPNAVGWCQFGPTTELPNIRSKKSYEQGLGKLPDWRITCFFIDRERRGKASPPSPFAKRFDPLLNSAAERSRPTPRTTRTKGPPPPSCAAELSVCSRRWGSGRRERSRCVDGSWQRRFGRLERSILRSEPRGSVSSGLETARAISSPSVRTRTVGRRGVAGPAARRPRIPGDQPRQQAPGDGCRQGTDNDGADGARDPVEDVEVADYPRQPILGDIRRLEREFPRCVRSECAAREAPRSCGREQRRRADPASASAMDAAASPPTSTNPTRLRGLR